MAPVGMIAGLYNSGADAARKLNGEDECGGVVELDSNLASSEGANIYSRHHGDADSKFWPATGLRPTI